MNFQQLKSRTIALCKLEGWSEVSPSPEWGTLVNQALAEFSWEAEYVVAALTITMIADMASYTLPSPPEWKRVTDAVFGTSTLLRLVDENILRRWNPNWIVAPSATPQYFFTPGSNTIQFYPTPSGSGDTVTIRGYRADGPLVDETDSPTCPAHYHEGIALLAAWKQGKAYANADALPRLDGYRAEAQAYMDKMSLYMGEQEGPAFQRRVQRSPADRIPLGWITPVR